MNRLVITPVLVLLLFSGIGQARDYCSENWACAGVVHYDGKREFWLENKRPYPITMTLKVRASNLQDEQGTQSNRFEKTVVLEGLQKAKVLSLEPVSRWQGSNYRYDFKWNPGSMYAQHDDSYRYLLPYAKNQYYRIVQGFDGGYSHQGASRYALDFAMPVGTPVHAAREGVVIDLKEHNWRGGANRRYAKYANYVVLLHDDGTTGEYYHLQQNGVVVAIGDRVRKGQHIAYSGNTGFSSLPHLHFAVYKAKSHGKFQSVRIKMPEATSRYKNRRQYGD